MARQSLEKEPLLDPSSSSSIYDVLIVGAGISGINAAYRIQSAFPTASYTILEARHAIGGTWDFFRYPGLRSDSDLHSFGFSWQPWSKHTAIVDGPSIRNYINETAEAHGIAAHVRFGHKLVHANWSSPEQCWQLDVDVSEQDTIPGGEKEKKKKNEGPRRETYQARFIFFATGYYDYNEPLAAVIPGLENFRGTVVHPQFWPEDLDYADKKVVIIGSGATAITLLPALAETAKSTTMLQRSPSYILSVPRATPPGWIAQLLPVWLYLKLQRLRYIIIAWLLYEFCRAFPNAARKVLRKATEKQLPKNIALDPHFEPLYAPWDQRLCFCPNGDFFAALRSGRASIATGTISTMTGSSIQLTSGDTLPADIIVTATGLKLHVAGGATLSVDDAPVAPSDKYMWRGLLLQDVPNAAVVVGYTNASWTLGSDASAVHVARILKYMQKRGYTAVVPRVSDPEALVDVPILNIKSTYVQRGKSVFPKTAKMIGGRGGGPWRPRAWYFRDIWEAKYGGLGEGLEFLKGGQGKGKGMLGGE